MAAANGLGRSPGIHPYLAFDSMSQPRFVTPIAYRRAGGAARAGGSAYEPRETPFPLTLQRSAGDALWRHLRRAILRSVVLLVADVATLLALRAGLRAVRDGALLGPGLAAMLEDLVPRGTFAPRELLASILLGLLILRTYGAGDQRRDVPSVVIGTGLGTTLIFWARLWTERSLAAVDGAALTWFAIAAGLLLERFVVERVVRRVRRQSSAAARALLVGAGDQVQASRSRAPLSSAAEFRVVGFLDVDPYPAADALGGISDFARVVTEHRVDTVVLCGNFSEDLFVTLLLLADAAGCQVLSLPRFSTMRGFEPHLVWRRGVPLIQLTKQSLRLQHLLFKRALDLIGSLALLLLLLPLLAAIALAVKLSSPGPVFFGQERVGVGGRRFRIWKFRTMVVGADARRAALLEQSIYGDARLFKIPRDPRVTRVGAFLRRTSLDELPQLVNVLLGDMSLVGPRPPIPAEVDLYEEHHYTRFDMRPGITGPWQVNGRNRITDFEQVVQLEMQYLRGWTIWRDIEILLRTVPAVLRMDGAH